MAGKESWDGQSMHLVGTLAGLQKYSRVTTRCDWWEEFVSFHLYRANLVSEHNEYIGRIARFPLRFSFSSQDVSPFVILISKEPLSLHFSLPDSLSFKNITGKCLFLSLRVKLGRHSVCTLVLGWTVFSSLETFLVLFLSRCFPHHIPHPIHHCLLFFGLQPQFPFSKSVIYTSLLFLCLRFWLDVFFYPQHHCFLCSVVSVMQTATSRCFQLFYSHGITAICCCCHSDLFPLIVFWLCISFKVVATKFALLAPEALQIPSSKTQVNWGFLRVHCVETQLIST